MTMSENVIEQRRLLAIGLYTTWTVLMGAGLLRVRIDCNIGDFVVILGMFLMTIGVCIVGWLVAFEPWGRCEEPEADNTERVGYRYE